MEKEVGRGPQPERPTPSEQHAKQIEQTPDIPGGDVFVAHEENIQPRIPQSGKERKPPALDTGVDLRAVFSKTVEGIHAEGSTCQSVESISLQDQLSPYLNEFPHLAGNTSLIIQARNILREPVEIPDWVYALGVTDAISSIAQEIREQQLRDLFSPERIKQPHPEDTDTR